MSHILQTPFNDDKRFEDLIFNQKSLVVFVRHPG
jgi:hypothetical protein